MPVIQRVACIQLALAVGIAILWGWAAGPAAGWLVLAGGVSAAMLTLSMGVGFMRRLTKAPNRPIGALLMARALMWLLTLALLTVVLSALKEGALPFLVGFCAAALGYLFALLWT